MSPLFQPSAYQQAIFQFVQQGRGHGVVDAVPGSGKTTTLLKSADLLRADARMLFVAFNAHSAAELSAKLKAAHSPMECSTIHSLGKRLLGKTRVDDKKYRNLSKEYLLSWGDESGGHGSTQKAGGFLPPDPDRAHL